jgi:glucan phosphoethanolaminetransferase (alkaline phosphatase superfamily)
MKPFKPHKNFNYRKFYFSASISWLLLVTVTSILLRHSETFSESEPMVAILRILIVFGVLMIPFVIFISLVMRAFEKLLDDIQKKIKRRN